MNMCKKTHGALRRLFSLGVKTLITVSLFVCYSLTICLLQSHYFFSLCLTVFSIPVWDNIAFGTASYHLVVGIWDPKLLNLRPEIAEFGTLIAWLFEGENSGTVRLLPTYIILLLSHYSSPIAVSLFWENSETPHYCLTILETAQKTAPKWAGNRCPKSEKKMKKTHQGTNPSDFVWDPMLEW